MIRGTDDSPDPSLASGNPVKLKDSGPGKISGADWLVCESAGEGLELLQTQIAVFWCVELDKNGYHPVDNESTPVFLWLVCDLAFQFLWCSFFSFQHPPHLPCTQSFHAMVLYVTRIVVRIIVEVVVQRSSGPLQESVKSYELSPWKNAYTHKILLMILVSPLIILDSFVEVWLKKPWSKIPGSSVGWSTVLIHQGCGFDFPSQDTCKNQPMNA